MTGVCSHAREPGKFACREALYSDGRSCRKCDVRCYRAGWSVDRVTEDMEKFVATKRRGTPLRLAESKPNGVKKEQ